MAKTKRMIDQSLYKPLPPGYADEHFKPRLRACGKPGCGRTFETTPAFRYFCPKCRATKTVRNGLSPTFSIGG